jgi:phosphoribosyl-AMP cyclohydrolase
VVASGGISQLSDVVDCRNLQLYGTICGKAIYTGDLDLREAVTAASQSGQIQTANGTVVDAALVDRFFQKAELLPAIVQEASTKEVLMLAYMNRESMQKTLETGYTWFYSRSRQELWNKGATSGHLQKVISIHGDCDDDTLLVVVEQTGAACHTGEHSCFFNEIWRD